MISLIGESFQQGLLYRHNKKLKLLLNNNLQEAFVQSQQYLGCFIRFHCNRKKTN